MSGKLFRYTPRFISKPVSNTRASVTIEFSAVVLMLVSVLFFGNETFRINQLTGRVQQTADSIVQVISTQTGKGITLNDLDAVVEASASALQPFYRILDTAVSRNYQANGVCFFGNMITVTQSQSLKCGIAYVRYIVGSCIPVGSTTATGGWQIVWQYGNGANTVATRCPLSCLGNMMTSGSTPADPAVTVFNVSQLPQSPLNNDTAVISWVQMYHRSAASAFLKRIGVSIEIFTGRSSAAMGPVLDVNQTASITDLNRIGLAANSGLFC